MPGGRPPKMSREEKATERKQKEDNKRQATERQNYLDLELLRKTRAHNPFRFTINKQLPAWTSVAAEINDSPGEDRFDDRRSRERVRSMMANHKKKPPTGTGTDEKTEQVVILDFLVEEEERTDNHKKEEKEKEENNRKITAKIQQQALSRLPVRGKKDLADMESAVEEPMDPDEPPTVTNIKKMKVHRFSRNRDGPVYRRPRPPDPNEEYLEKKREQAAQELKLKMDMHDKDLEDGEAERELKREAMAIEREKNAMEERERERERRYQLEKTNQANMYELMKAAILGKQQE